jgi:hypothetical protein
MTEYRVTWKRIARGDEVFEEGDVFEPTDAELDAFGDRLEPVDGDEDNAEDGDELDTAPFDPAEYTNEEIAERVEVADDEEALHALLDLEENQQDRDGATSAIEERLEEL